MPRWALELLMAPFAVPKIRDRPCCDVDWNPPRRAGGPAGSAQPARRSTTPEEGRISKIQSGRKTV